MRKYILAALLFFPSIGHGAFTTDWFRNTSSSITINGSTYTWNAGLGGAGKFLQNVNGVITSETPSGSGSSSYGVIYSSNSAISQSVSTTPVKATIFNANGLSSGMTADHTNDQITVSSSGVYSAFANIISTSGTSGLYNYHYEIRTNGVNTGLTCQDTAFPKCTMFGPISLNANDVVSIYVFSDSTTASTIITTDAQLYLTSGGGGSGSGSSGTASVGSLYVTTHTANTQSIDNTFVKYTGFSTAGDSTEITVSTITDRITISTPGYYVAYTVLESSAADVSLGIFAMECQIRVNGSYVNVEGGEHVTPGTTGGASYTQCSALGAFNLSANDYLEVYVALSTETAVPASHYHGQFIVAAVGGSGGSSGSGTGDNLGNHVATMTLTTGFGILASTAHFTAGITISSNSLTPGATARFLPNLLITDSPYGPYSTALEITTNTVHRGYIEADRELYIGPGLTPSIFDLSQQEIFNTDTLSGVRLGYTGAAPSGEYNILMGYLAGSNSTSLTHSVIVGNNAGIKAGADEHLTLYGYAADKKLASSTFTYASAFGAEAVVNCDNCTVIGSANPGFFVGIGTDTPTNRLEINNGNLQIDSTNQIKFADADSSNYISFRSSNTLAYNQLYVLPNSTGSVDDVMSIRHINTDGSRALYWRTVTAAGGDIPIEVFSNFDFLRSSPTYSIATGDGLKLTVSGSTAIINVDPSSYTSRADAILNSQTLEQKTIYVSSQSIEGRLVIKSTESNSSVHMYHSHLPINGGFGPQVVTSYIHGVQNVDGGVADRFVLLGSTMPPNQNGATSGVTPAIYLNPPATANTGTIGLSGNYNDGTTGFSVNVTSGIFTSLGINANLLNNCSGYANIGKITVDNDGNFVCRDDVSGGSTIYNATSTAGFPYGHSASTGVYTSTLTVGTLNSGVGQSEFSLGLIVNSSTGGTTNSNFQVKGDNNASLIQTNAALDQVSLGTATFTNSLTLNGTLVVNNSSGTSTQVLFSRGPGLSPKWDSAAAIYLPVSNAGTSTNYTLSASTENFLIVNNASAVTVNLPTAVGLTGKVFTVKRLSTLNNVTIEGDGSETIDGAANLVLSTQYHSATILSDGSNWHVLSRGYP